MLLSRRDFQSYYWASYLVCERDLLTLAEYVALREGNLNTCSVRIAQLYLFAVNGVESVLKILYPEVSNTVHAREFLRALLSDGEFDKDQAVCVSAGQDLAPIVPFAGLEDSKDGIPRWWIAHTELKHDRMIHFEKGNLSNLLASMAAYYYLGKLYMLENQKRWQEESGNCRDSFDYPDVDSSVFELPRWRARFAPPESSFVIEDGTLHMIFGRA